MKSTLLLIIGCIVSSFSYSQIEPIVRTYPQFPNYDPLTPSILTSSMLFSNWHITKKKIPYSEGFKRDKAQYRMNLVYEFYKAQKDFPTMVTDGWHEVVAMNNYDKCEQVKVFVENNMVKEYVVDEWEYKDIVAPVEIKYGKAEVQLVNERSKRKKKRIFLDLYFVDYMTDPSHISTPPILPGKISFWAPSNLLGGTISVYINGNLKGTLDPSLYNNIPECGDRSTLTIEYKSGIHEFNAINKRNAWRGEIIIYPGECKKKVLSKENNTATKYQK